MNLNEWLSQMKKLEAERASEDFDTAAEVMYVMADELPRAVKLIELLLGEQCRATECTEDMKILEAKIQKILEEK